MSHKRDVKSHLDYCDFIYDIPDLKKDKYDEKSLKEGSHVDASAHIGTADDEGHCKIHLNFWMRPLESTQNQEA